MIMAKLEILHFPDPRLRQKALPVTQITPQIHQIVNDMLETMYDNNGIGLAAIQVNILQRIIVMDISEQRNEPLHWINPEILAAQGDSIQDEGCLSVPDIFEPVHRASQITVRALDLNGVLFERQASDLLAICIQHEIDHLDGKLFVDHLSALKRQRIRKKIDKWNRQNPTTPALKPSRRVG